MREALGLAKNLSSSFLQANFEIHRYSDGSTNARLSLYMRY